MNKLIKKNLVIPMCGRGKRFRDGGYKSYKSMLQINYKNMLERIIQNFSCEEIDIYLITSDPIFTLFKSHKDWGKLKSKINLIKIKEHILGPAYSIYKAYSQIPKSRGTFISYCDITWHWDETIKPLELNDAAIFCHYGFHPHLIKDNYSAFCKPKKENPRELEEIKEKSSFTDNWMNEPLSVGLFYIKDISIIKKPLDLMIKDNKRVSNEFFPSLIFNYILNNNFKVNLIPVKSFVHYGTPSQFEDINDWSQYFFKKNINKDKTKIELYPSIIFASGKGNRMKKISKNNKALIKTGEKRLIDFVLDALPIKKSKTSIVFNDNEIKNHYKKYEINFFRIPKTNSQYESLLESLKLIEKQKNFFLCSCDCFGYYDDKLFESLIKKELYDVVCFGFKPSLLQLKLNSSYSTFSCDGEKLTKLFVKEVKNESSYGLAGFFWIKDGLLISKFIKEYNFENKEREIIIDDIISYACSEKFSIANIPLSKYVHLGSAEEYKEYLYWEANIKSLLK